MSRNNEHTPCLRWIATGPLLMVFTTADLWLLSSGSSPSSLCGKMEIIRVNVINWMKTHQKPLPLITKLNSHCLYCKRCGCYLHPAHGVVLRCCVRAHKGKKKCHASARICQIPVKMQWDGFQTTYLLTERRQIWYQTKQSTPPQPKPHRAQLHGALLTYEHRYVSRVPLSQPNRVQATGIMMDWRRVGLHTGSEMMPIHQCKWLKGQ